MPSHARTARALSRARSSREPELGTAPPESCFVWRSSWTVAFRASAAVAAWLARKARNAERGDPGAHLLLAAVERVERLLEIVDLDVLGKDRAEAREPGDRVGGVGGRDPECQRRGALVARGVLHRDDVAPEIPGDPERLLCRVREGVVVLHLERERGAVALEAAREGAGCGL